MRLLNGKVFFSFFSFCSSICLCLLHLWLYVNAILFLRPTSGHPSLQSVANFNIQSVLFSFMATNCFHYQHLISGSRLATLIQNTVWGGVLSQTASATNTTPAGHRSSPWWVWYNGLLSLPQSPLHFQASCFVRHLVHGKDKQPSSLQCSNFGISDTNVHRTFPFSVH